jgi:hypothetical protein
VSLAGPVTQALPGKSAQGNLQAESLASPGQANVAAVLNHFFPEVVRFFFIAAETAVAADECQQQKIVTTPALLLLPPQEPEYLATHHPDTFCITCSKDPRLFSWGCAKCRSMMIL